ncbi:Fatty-acyl-CoA synthase [Saliniradius amylolyticus]|uniref:Fatty-acyl-CoA synthase n=1 Tax=Saliniradius amylolyticus TaxID=2183582 RepID=A0A2S2E484_9ALTE|nr:MaoC/PaaZ C-terminal domain-containing protein [Saliniradius amylolyticus]AWL12461.1 Fatty-acyl-CoA synthase [Saliniradius amylolyticus]
MNNGIRELRQPPALLPLFVKAVAKRSRAMSEPALPQHRLALTMRPITAKLKAYHRLVGWQGEGIHPCWLQVRALPLQLSLLTDKCCPFAVMGLMHMKNRIQQYQPVRENMALELSCSLDALKKHRMGWQFEILTQARHHKKLVWESVATSLAPTVKVQAGQRQRQAPEPPEVQALECWSLEADLGRRYASVSGDYNPIHLHPLTSSMFGFPQPIIHGMWSYARILSALTEHGYIDTDFSSSVTFKRPLVLPGDAELYLNGEEASVNQGRFELRAESGHKVLLNGDWQALRR